MMRPPIFAYCSASPPPTVELCGHWARRAWPLWVPPHVMLGFSSAAPRAQHALRATSAQAQRAHLHTNAPWAHGPRVAHPQRRMRRALSVLQALAYLQAVPRLPLTSALRVTTARPFRVAPHKHLVPQATTAQLARAPQHRAQVAPWEHSAVVAFCSRRCHLAPIAPRAHASLRAAPQPSRISAHQATIAQRLLPTRSRWLAPRATTALQVPAQPHKTPAPRVRGPRAGRPSRALHRAQRAVRATA